MSEMTVLVGGEPERADVTIRDGSMFIVFEDVSLDEMVIGLRDGGQVGQPARPRASAEDDVDVYEGRIHRLCPECGVEVQVIKPRRKLSRTSTRAWRKRARQEVARQIMWEAISSCGSCRGFWNGVLRDIEEVPEQKAA